MTTLLSLQLCLMRVGCFFKRIVVTPISDYYNLYEFLRVLAAFLAYYADFPMPLLHTFRFTFACESRGMNGVVIIGTGGNILDKVKVRHALVLPALPSASGLSVCLSFRLSICLPACLPACMSVCLSARLSVCLSAILSACLSGGYVLVFMVLMSVCLFVGLPVCLSVCVSGTNILDKIKRRPMLDLAAVSLSVCPLGFAVSRRPICLSSRVCSRLSVLSGQQSAVGLSVCPLGSTVVCLSVCPLRSAIGCRPVCLSSTACNRLLAFLFVLSGLQSAVSLSVCPLGPAISC